MVDFVTELLLLAVWLARVAKFTAFVLVLDFSNPP